MNSQRHCFHELWDLTYLLGGMGGRFILENDLGVLNTLPDGDSNLIWKGVVCVGGK